MHEHPDAHHRPTAAVGVRGLGREHGKRGRDHPVRGSAQRRHRFKAGIGLLHHEGIEPRSGEREAGVGADEIGGVARLRNHPRQLLEAGRRQFGEQACPIAEMIVERPVRHPEPAGERAQTEIGLGLDQAFGQFQRSSLEAAVMVGLTRHGVWKRAS
jgi:hypothetical protein